MTDKIARLESIIKGMGSVLVAFSGGVDSTLLLYAASRFLGDKAAAGTVITPLLTAAEVERAQRAAALLRVRHLTPELDIFSRPEIVSNPPQRCYHCKLAVFRLLKEEAARLGFSQVVDGTQVDDNADFRPGLLALMDLSVRSPLAEAGINKEDVRRYVQIFKLPGAEAPSSPCLATRIPFHRPITREALARVAAAEEHLHRLGLSMCRVRDHFPAAVIEVPEDQVERLAAWPLRRDVYKSLKEVGYAFVAADLEGYRRGSMNEAVIEKIKRKPLI